MSKVLVMLHPPECEVCGHPVNPEFLQAWNGKDVCKYCLNEIHEESELIDANYYPC